MPTIKRTKRRYSDTFYELRRVGVPKAIIATSSENEGFADEHYPILDALAEDQHYVHITIPGPRCLDEAMLRYQLLYKEACLKVGITSHKVDLYAVMGMPEQEFQKYLDNLRNQMNATRITYFIEGITEAGNDAGLSSQDIQRARVIGYLMDSTSNPASVVCYTHIMSRTIEDAGFSKLARIMGSDFAFGLATTDMRIAL